MIFSIWFITFVVNFIAVDLAILKIYVFVYVFNIVGKISNDTFLEYYHARRSVTVNAQVLCSRFVLMTIFCRNFHETEKSWSPLNVMKYIIGHKYSTPQLVPWEIVES